MSPSTMAKDVLSNNDADSVPLDDEAGIVQLVTRRHTVGATAAGCAPLVVRSGNVTHVHRFTLHMRRPAR